MFQNTFTWLYNTTWGKFHCAPLVPTPPLFVSVLWECRHFFTCCSFQVVETQGLELSTLHFKRTHEKRIHTSSERESQWKSRVGETFLKKLSFGPICIRLRLHVVETIFCHVDSTEQRNIGIFLHSSSSWLIPKASICDRKRLCST